MLGLPEPLTPNHEDNPFIYALTHINAKEKLNTSSTGYGLKSSYNDIKHCRLIITTNDTFTCQRGQRGVGLGGQQALVALKTWNFVIPL
jgi:hypothetical protein